VFDPLTQHGLARFSEVANANVGDDKVPGQGIGTTESSATSSHHVTRLISLTFCMRQPLLFV
jgi:hypothetical protein